MKSNITLKELETGKFPKVLYSLGIGKGIYESYIIHGIGDVYSILHELYLKYKDDYWNSLEAEKTLKCFQHSLEMQQKQRDFLLSQGGYENVYENEIDDLKYSVSICKQRVEDYKKMEKLSKETSIQKELCEFVLSESNFDYCEPLEVWEINP